MAAWREKLGGNCFGGGVVDARRRWASWQAVADVEVGGVDVMQRLRWMVNGQTVERQEENESEVAHGREEVDAAVCAAERVRMKGG